MLRKNICLYLLIGAILCLNLVQAAPDDAASDDAAPDDAAPDAAKAGSDATDSGKDAGKLPQPNDILSGIIKPALAVPRGFLDAFGNAFG